MENIMKKIVTTLLLFLALLGFSGPIGSPAAASTSTSVKMMSINDHKLACSPNYLPDLDPGSPFGWPEQLRDLSASHHRYGRPDSSCDADLSGMGSDEPYQSSGR
jgi:hypothetical protein